MLHSCFGTRHFSIVPLYFLLFFYKEANKMLESTPISEMQKFHFGGKIHYADGEEGTLVYAIFDPATLCLTHMGVKASRLFGRVTELPYRVTDSATADGVLINATKEDIEESAPTNGVKLDNKSTVERAGFSDKGVLRTVAVHPQTGELAYIIAEHLKSAHAVMISRNYLTSVGDGKVTITIPDAVLTALPPFRSDKDLQKEVDSLLFDFTPLHVDMKGISARVLDSVLYLDGNISSSLRSDIVQDQISGMQGLLEVKNTLLGDDELAADLAMALGRDKRTRDLPIGVYPRLGEVRLNGSVKTLQQKNAVGEIANTFPGVRAVYNDLEVKPDTDLLPIMATTGNGQDIAPGKFVRHTK